MQRQTHSITITHLNKHRDINRDIDFERKQYVCMLFKTYVLRDFIKTLGRQDMTHIFNNDIHASKACLLLFSGTKDTPEEVYAISLDFTYQFSSLERKPIYINRLNTCLIFHVLLSN